MRGLRVLALILLLFPGNAYAQQKPNIVLVLMDNLGWGEPGVYGGGVWAGASYGGGSSALNFWIASSVRAVAE